MSELVATVARYVPYGGLIIGRSTDKAVPGAMVVYLCRSTIGRRLVANKHAPQDHAQVTGMESTALDRVACQEVSDALMALPSRQRQALVLRIYADLTEREVAEVMDVSVGTVKSSDSRAKDAPSKMVEVQQ